MIIGAAMQFPITLDRAKQRGAPAGRLAALKHGVGLAHAAQINE